MVRLRLQPACRGPHRDGAVMPPGIIGAAALWCQVITQTGLGRPREMGTYPDVTACAMVRDQVMGPGHACWCEQAKKEEDKER